MEDINELRTTPTGDVVMEVALEHGAHTRAEILRRIGAATGVDIQRQKFDQWVTGAASFSNDFADLFSRAFDLSEREMIKVSLALAYGQKTRRLQPAKPPGQAAADPGK